MKGNNSMMTRLYDIPFDRLLSCEWVIITHKLDRYFFENNRCFLPHKELKPIKCGGSIGYKINGKFRSLTWLKQNRKPHIEVWCRNIQLIPF